MFKRMISLLIMIIALCSLAQGNTLTVGSEKNERIELIHSFFNCIDNNEWERFPEFYVSKVRSEKEELVGNNLNIENGLGILAIKSIKILDIEYIEDCPLVLFYSDLEEYYKSKETYCVYKVTVEETTRVNSEFYPDGIAGHLIILVKENGRWWVGRTKILTETVTKGQKWGFIDYQARPSTIVMKDENGTISTVAFYDYLFNVACNEFGNMSSFSNDCFKANVMALKMFGWFAKAGHMFSEDNCDLKYGFVSFKSVNDANSTDRARVASAIKSTCKYYTVSSSGTGGKLFTLNFTQGGYNGNGQHLGQISQYGSDYLSDNYSYSWRDIIHYYYDYSTNNHLDVGVVQIKNNSHSYSGYESNMAQHWKTCSFCGYETTHTAHTWIDNGSYLECSVCGRINYVDK